MTGSTTAASSPSSRPAAFVDTFVDLDDSLSSGGGGGGKHVAKTKKTKSDSVKQQEQQQQQKKEQKARLQAMRNSVNEKQRHLSSIFGYSTSGTKSLLTPTATTPVVFSIFDRANRESESEDVSSVGSLEGPSTSPHQPASILGGSSSVEHTETTAGTSSSTKTRSSHDVESNVGIEWTDYQHSAAGIAWSPSKDGDNSSTTTPIDDLLHPPTTNSARNIVRGGFVALDENGGEENNSNDPRHASTLTVPSGDSSSDNENAKKENNATGGVGKSNRRSLISCCWDGGGERAMPDYDEHLGEGRQYWRDIILGVNDGLVSTFLLIAGVTGASLSNTDILLTALSGTIAGAISMAAGEYVATKTQTEVMEGEIALERKHISKNRDFELAELKEAFGIIGIPEEDDSPEVVQLRQNLMNYYASHDEAHLQVHAVLELGVVEEEKRNPFVAGGVAFFLFFFGAMPSVIPFLCTSDITSAFIAAAVCTTTGLLLVGAVKTWATRGNLWLASLENLLIAAGGGSIAYGVGVGFEKVVNG